MNFEIIKDKVQLGHRGYIRHKLIELPEGELIQKCVLCGQVIEDLTPLPNSFYIAFDSKGKKIDYVDKGSPSGYIYISIQQNPSTRIHEILEQFGAIMPTDYIDCTTLNS